MDEEFAGDILCCPNCGSSLQIATSGMTACNCGQPYGFDDGIFDFQVEEQKYTNAWSNPNPEQALKILVDKGILTEEDVQHVFTPTSHPEELARAEDMAYRELFALMTAPDVNTILDLCTGWGSLFEEEKLRRLVGKRVILTDLSKFVLKKVRERIMGFGLDDQFLFLSCDCRRLPVKPDKVDLVTSWSGLGNADNSEEILPEVFRVLVCGKSFIQMDRFYKEDSRTIRASKKMGGGDLGTQQRMETELVKVGFNVPEFILNYEGIGHAEGDLFPLKGDWAAWKAIVKTEKPK